MNRDGTLDLDVAVPLGFGAADGDALGEGSIGPAVDNLNVELARLAAEINSDAVPDRLNA